MQPNVQIHVEDVEIKAEQKIHNFLILRYFHAQDFSPGYFLKVNKEFLTLGKFSREIVDVQNFFEEVFKLKTIKILHCRTL